MVKSINHYVDKAVSKVTETTQTVNSQDDAITQSQIIFSDIIESINGLSGKVSEITADLSGINQMKDDVLLQVETLSAILEETTAGTEEVCASANVVQTSANQFVNTLSKLSDMSQDLSEQIQKFNF